MAYSVNAAIFSKEHPSRGYPWSQIELSSIAGNHDLRANHQLTLRDTPSQRGVHRPKNDRNLILGTALFHLSSQSGS